VAAQLYYANEVPDAVVSGTRQLLDACDAWPHQEAPPDLSATHIANHLSVCYVARHPNAMNDVAWAGMVEGAALGAGAVILTLGLLLAVVAVVRRLRRRVSREAPPPSLKVPLKRIIQADQQRERLFRTLQDLHAELSLDARGGGRKQSL
jgi:hypothetical protein